MTIFKKTTDLAYGAAREKVGRSPQEECEILLIKYLMGMSPENFIRKLREEDEAVIRKSLAQGHHPGAPNLAKEEEVTDGTKHG